MIYVRALLVLFVKVRFQISILGLSSYRTLNIVNIGLVEIIISFKIYFSQSMTYTLSFLTTVIGRAKVLNFDQAQLTNFFLMVFTFLL